VLPTDNRRVPAWRDQVPDDNFNPPPWLMQAVGRSGGRRADALAPPVRFDLSGGPSHNTGALEGDLDLGRLLAENQDSR
jgi:hypothetical protein